MKRRVNQVVAAKPKERRGPMPVPSEYCRGNCGAKIDKHEAATHCEGPGCDYLDGYCVTCKADCAGWDEEACRTATCTPHFFCNWQCRLKAAVPLQFYKCPNNCDFCADCAKPSSGGKCTGCASPFRSCQNDWGTWITCPQCERGFCPACG